MSQHKEQQGFLTVAANTADTDYLRLAYLQALNIKATQRITSYAVVVDAATALQVQNYHRSVFDYIIEAPASATGPFGLEPAAFWLTPFKETVKVESDLLFTRSIDHWWTAFRLCDIVLSTGCQTYQQQPATSRRYRKLFDDNHLPDVYNGLMYFRFSQSAANFFRIARQIFEQWPEVRNSLLGCSDEYASTDVAYAIAANIIGPELCTLPSADFINFVHMKSSINGYDEALSFQDVYVTEFDSGMIRINNINQYHPLHYHDKTFATEEMIDYYRSLARVS
jgi:hypothetical protein